MNTSVAHPGPSRSTDESLAELIEELSAKLEKRMRVDVPAYLEAHPAHAEELRRLLPAMQLLADWSRSGTAQVPASASETEPAPTALGDFRIVREVGRGGMGIVYEAEQLSLGRRVALKVLPFAGTLDARRLQRFKNEAQAAAHLQHQHIVPVYFVGQERGVHYYAMQFVEGRTLASLIAEARPTQDASGSKVPDITTNYVPADTAVATIKAHSATVDAKASATGTAVPGSTAYFRTVAQWGEQAAEALEHAHQMGVIHRDVKPANLIVDSQGHLWITDFGLAQFQSDSHLTLTGDLVGTLRYMSPEQALAKRVPIDHRTDVYSLGVTLYELLTLQPAFAGQDRQDVMRQIAFEEPTALRKRNKTIPAELETIVLKAMAKVPEERYATAQELADDLRHWLEDRAIRARRPSVVLRLRRWGRRHRSVVAGLRRRCWWGWLSWADV
jgi:eukaryotic-like serine/threonine-protein kinase